MAVPNVMRIPVEWQLVAPYGVLFLGVEPEIDFDKRNQADNQKRDKETGERIWVVKVLDLDPEAGKFGGSKELKIRMLAPVQPVPPASAVPGYPPAVEFENVTISPWADSQRCKPPTPGAPHRCRARLSWSIRATDMVEPQPVGKSNKAA